MEIIIGGKYHHKKTGKIVRITGLGTIEATMQCAVYYEHIPRDEYGTWARPLMEFTDGRFEPYVEPKPEVPPVDRSARELCSGAPVPPDHSHTKLKNNGQQEDYVVLSEAERAKGFVRPVRRSYVHEKCGVMTMMNQALAETYARDPSFYSGTFCVGCGGHRPVGEFIWAGTNEKVGT